MSETVAPDWEAVAPKNIPAVTGVPMDRVRRDIQSGALEVIYPSPKRQIATRDAIRRWLAAMANERPGAA